MLVAMKLTILTANTDLVLAGRPFLDARLDPAARAEPWPPHWRRLACA